MATAEVELHADQCHGGDDDDEHGDQFHVTTTSRGQGRWESAIGIPEWTAGRTYPKVGVPVRRVLLDRAILSRGSTCTKDGSVKRAARLSGG